MYNSSVKVMSSIEISGKRKSKTWTKRLRSPGLFPMPALPSHLAIPGTQIFTLQAWHSTR